jgi:uncharacterized protein (UPF0332 family)
MMDEQRVLLLRSQQSLRAARVLRDNGFPEYAAARAYYTMFYVVEALLIGKDMAFSKHGAVHAAFGQHFCKTGLVDPRFFRYLEEGMAVRHSGDYAKGHPVTVEKMDEQIAHAEEFLKLAECFIGPIPPETET